MLAEIPDHQQPTLGDKLKQTLDGPSAPFLDELRQWAGKFAFPHRLDLSRPEFRESAVQFVRTMAEDGYGGLPYPKSVGGEDDFGKYINLFEVVAQISPDYTVKQGVNFGLFGGAVVFLGTQEQQQAFLPALMKGEILGGFAATEEGGGSNLMEVGTTATYDRISDSFVIHTPNAQARKTYIGNAAQHGHYMAVVAQLDMNDGTPGKGPHIFIVPVRDIATGMTAPGVTITDNGPKTGLNGVDNGTLSFDHVRVSSASLLQHYAQITRDGEYTSDIENPNKRFFTQFGTLVRGRICVSASALSMAKCALSDAVSYAEEREVFGSTLMDTGIQQERLLPMIAESYALHFANRHLARTISQNPRHPDIELYADALKPRTTDAAFRMIDAASLVAGGRGYMSEERYGELRESADVWRRFEGTNDVLRLQTAKILLRAAGIGLSELSRPDQLRFVFEQEAKHQMRKFLPHRPQNNSVPSLMDPEFVTGLLDARESALTYRVIKDLKSLKAEHGMDIPQSVLPQQDMVELADAYTDGLVMTQMIDAVQREADPDVKAVLQDLYELQVCRTLRSHTVFLEEGFVSASQSRTLKDHEQTLYARIRPHVSELVKGFAVLDPAQAIPAPELEHSEDFYPPAAPETPESFIM